MKRLMDLGIASGLLALTLPFWPVLALLVKLDSRGPVFYRQKRVGKGGVVFGLVKFRSMIDKAENGDDPQWSPAGDRRVTAVGRVLRGLHLDELPQLLNVLSGEMSLVGPRPERPEFVESLDRAIPGYRERLAVKPGVTGWAQVNFPYAASVEGSRKKLQYDLDYIRRRSLALDVRIMAMTAHAVREGIRYIRGE